ncbi:MAG TPA: flagellar motor protein MotD, partial [Gammaproteobacteria bacterium]|nr:flagellar motor protein MotD [Gammaproteobacteria bacterium]
MARKQKHEEHENHERWLVSYADFITLLFAFFVVMYAISSVNEGKYRVLSDALVAAFRSSPKSLEPIQIGSLSKAPVISTAQENHRKPAMMRLPKMYVSQTETLKGLIHEPLMEEKYVNGDDQVNISRIADAVREALQSLVDQGLINIRKNALWVEVEIRDSVLFPSGSARLQEEALPVLEEVARILRDFPNPIRVEGFTDNVPISTIVYPSNWELSAARAASVVRLFADAGIDPSRMVAQGYGEYRPVADNDTPEGRAKNRRVVIVVLADDQVARLLGDRARAAQQLFLLPDDGDGLRTPADGESQSLATRPDDATGTAERKATPSTA